MIPDYFAGCKTTTEAHARYREWSKKLHPDRPGGSNDDFVELGKQYACFLNKAAGTGPSRKQKMAFIIQSFIQIRRQSDGRFFVSISTMIPRVIVTELFTALLVKKILVQEPDDELNYNYALHPDWQKKYQSIMDLGEAFGINIETVIKNLFTHGAGK